MKTRMLRVALAVVAACLAITDPASAAGYNIIIDDTILTHPIEIVFDEKDIAPGFSSTYQINIENRLSTPAQVKLDTTIENVPSNSPLLSETSFTFVYNGTPIAAGKHLSVGLTDQELICVAPQSNDTLDLKMEFDKDAGNDAQGASFELLFNFSATESSCMGSGGEDGTNGGPKWPLPPNTGNETVLPPTRESSAALYTSIGVIIVSLFLTLLFGLLVLFGRKKDDDKKAARKPVYTPKRRGGLEIKSDKKH